MSVPAVVYFLQACRAVEVLLYLMLYKAAEFIHSSEERDYLSHPKATALMICKV